MNDNIALFVLGNLFLIDTEHGKTPPSENIYRHDANGGHFPGIQANEAPVEYLIQSGKDSGNPITDIVYLCPDSCLVPKIPVSQAALAIPGLNAVSDLISTEEFFLERIRSYCEANDCALPMASPVPFNPLRPADSLDDLVGILGTGARVNIDITGGPRDAVILLALATQIIKMGAKGTTIGEVLYTNFSEKTIYKQNNSFDLIDLVNAIDSFTDYGRADQLKAFFDGNPYIKEPTRKLCRAMEDFADALTLCQVDNIEEKVLLVQQCLDDMERELGDLKETYKLYTDAIEQIDNNSDVREKTFLEALGEISSLNPSTDFSAYKNDALADELDKLRRPAMMNRAELLFLSLIPAIRDKFIPSTTDQASLTLELIKWCSNHQMVIQALCIYRERIGQCLLDKGYFTPLDAAHELEDDKRSNEISDLLLNCSFGNRDLFLCAGMKTRKLRETPNAYYGLNKSKEGQLRLIAIWFRYLHATRNTIVHADGDRGSFAYFFAMAFLGKDRDETVEIEALRKDILEAIAVIEKPRTVSRQDWQDARSIAFNDLSRYKQRVSDGSNRLEVLQYAHSSQEAGGTSLGNALDSETRAKLEAIFGKSDG